MSDYDPDWLAAHPPFDCKLCGERQEHSEFGYNRLGFCGHCAREIADEYHLAHAGQYFFKPNPPRPADTLMFSPRCLPTSR